jgi:hypothetical protein
VTRHTPNPDELPSARALLRSTLVAIAIAAVILVCVVLPAEYGRDITGVGSLLGLTEMGRIKLQLAREATATATTSGESSAVATDDGRPKQDSLVITLPPAGSTEVKLSMRKGQKATYDWRADTVEVFYNMHGEPPEPPPGFNFSYGKGSSRGERGELTAEFDGIHGWFWRNRSAEAVTITLHTAGAYQALRRLK